jgi:hypothetical protein
MKEFVKWMNSTPKILKIIFALPGLDIIWSIYKLIKAIADNNVLEIVLAILLLFFGPTIMWILDLIWVVIYDRPFWF